ncbi:hypothetical protein DSO57_1001775 [Entomophthora muscae]|uniref:Uncharacterized protein n=1 Tax=Entomophthora muscae TaxID=34485 RepID=A0ACC2T8Q0_9FUNG|nr:hypothetical protein DSO57_1001775 [Entomophthora muscae]
MLQVGSPVMKKVPVSFFDTIPHFGFREICSYMDIDKLKGFRRINKTWNVEVISCLLGFLRLSVRKLDRNTLNFYKSYGKFMTGLNFLGANPVFSQKAVDAVRRNCHNITSLRIRHTPDWVSASQLIISLGFSQGGLKELYLSGSVTEPFIKSISPALKRLESFELGDDNSCPFLVAPLVGHLTCPRLRSLTIWWNRGKRVFWTVSTTKYLRWM